MSASIRALSVTLPITPVLPCTEDATWVCCLGCGAPLELHQPDAAEPQRFVGTCDQCGRWYLLDWIPHTAEGLMLLLPSHEDLLTAFKNQQER
jgi:hypothetical protein